MIILRSDYDCLASIILWVHNTQRLHETTVTVVLGPHTKMKLDLSQGKKEDKLDVGK